MSKENKPQSKIKNGFVFKFYEDNITPKIEHVEFTNLNTGVPMEFEPMRRNRFYVMFPEFFSIPAFTIRSVNLPALSNNIWENIRLEYIDLIGPSTSQGIMNMVQHCRMNQNTILFRFNIQQLDPLGVTVHRWDIDVAELVRVNFGDLNYEEDGLTTCSIELKPQNCILSF